jgi:hypothetical protein
MRLLTRGDTTVRITVRITVAALAALALTGCAAEQPAAAPPPATTAATTAAPAPSPTTPSPSPTPTMTRKQACQRVVEASVDWVWLIGRFVDDPAMESIGSSEVEGLATKIRDALPYLDDRTAEHARQMMYPLDIMYGVMTTGQNVTITLEDGRDAVPLVMKGCRGKASLKGYESAWER